MSLLSDINLTIYTILCTLLCTVLCLVFPTLALLPLALPLALLLLHKLAFLYREAASALRRTARDRYLDKCFWEEVARKRAWERELDDSRTRC